MAYPNNIDSFTEAKNYNDLVTEELSLTASSVPFLIEVSHDILSNVSFSAIYTQEVTTDPGIGQFRVFYNTNQIQLGPLSSNTTLEVTYRCRGDEIRAEYVNTLQTSVVNIEKTLGINPQGTFNTVADRLNSLTASTSLVPVHEVFYPDGYTSSFMLNEMPKSTDSVYVYLNGLRLVNSVDFTVSGQIVSLNFTPLSTDEIVIDYFK